jgi:2-dehydropantoate 2-reductase
LRVLVVGAGATGGLFGGRLALAGREVAFLVRPGRARQLRRDGLAIHGPRGVQRLQPVVVTAGDPVAAPDLVVLAVKAYALDQAVDDVAPAVGPRTLVLPLLNGLRHLDVLAARFGEDAVLGAVCRVSAGLDPDGAVRQHTDEAAVEYGGCGAADPAALRRVHTGLQGAGFDALPAEDIRTAMWRKWTLVAAIGAVTCLMRGLIGDVVAAPGGREFAERVAAECVATAVACGGALDSGDLRQVSGAVTQEGAKRASSLYWDLTRGGPTEADHIIGDLVARAEERGVDVPLLRLAHLHLRVGQGS